MAVYPKITGNTGGTNESAYDLLDAKDQISDFYVFKSPTTQVQEAFIVVVIKNTSSDTDLNIEDFVADNNFTTNNGFHLDPTINSVTGAGSTSTPFLGGYDTDGSRLNKISATPGNVIATTTNTSNATEAVGFIGVKAGGVSQSGDEFNVSSTNIVPIYSTAYLKANDIGFGCYAAILVRYAPTEAKDPFVSILTIKNNAGSFNVKFGSEAVNSVNYFGKEITVSTSNSETVIDLTSGGAIIQDQSVVDLGLWPTLTGANKNLDRNIIGKTFKFDDYSVVPGAYSYTDTFLNIYYTGLLVDQIASIDGQLTDQLDIRNFGFKEVFEQKTRALTIVKQDGSISYDYVVNLAANKSTYLDSDNVALIKSFGIGSSLGAAGENFLEQSSHIKKQSDWGSFEHGRYKANEHTSTGELSHGYNFRLGQIINKKDEDQVLGTSNYLYFTVKLGFYSVLTFNSLQTEKHRKAVINDSGDAPSSDVLSSFVNVDLSDLNKYIAPGFRSDKSSGGYMSRNSQCELNVSVRYNNFNGSDTYGIPTFNIKNNFGFYGEYFGNVSPTKYLADSEFTGFQATDFASASSADANYSGFDTAAEGGSLLALQYLFSPSTVSKDHLYQLDKETISLQPETSTANLYNDGRFKSLNKMGWREKDFGFITNSSNIIPRSSSYYTDYVSNPELINYKIAWLPKQSRIKVHAVNEEKNKFNIISQGEYYTASTTKKTTSNWYELGTSTTRSSGATSIGGWYGESGVAVYKPYCWNISNTGGFLTTRTGSTNANFTNRDGSSVAMGSNTRPFLPTGNFDGSDLTKPIVVHAPTDPTITKNTGNESVNSFSTGIDSYFELDNVTYDSVTNKMKAVGVLRLENTGDYPVYIQRLELNTDNHKIDGYNQYSSTQTHTPIGNNNTMLVPTSGANAKPHVNANTPDWKVFQMNADYLSYSTEQAATTVGQMDFYTSSASNDKGNIVIGDQTYFKDFPSNISSGQTKNAKTHYYTENSDTYVDATNGPISPRFKTSNASGGTRMFIPPNFDETPLDTRYNEIGISFEVTSTGSGATNNGYYYTQLAITYYVDEYGNRKTWTIDDTNPNGYSISDVELGDQNNLSSRLYVSKYLIAVNVSGIAEIELQDAEGDEIINGSTIELGNVNVG
jgi:hypothetical protein